MMDEKNDFHAHIGISETESGLMIGIGMPAPQDLASALGNLIVSAAVVAFKAIITGDQKEAYHLFSTVIGSMIVLSKATSGCDVDKLISKSVVEAVDIANRMRIDNEAGAIMAVVEALTKAASDGMIEVDKLKPAAPYPPKKDDGEDGRLNPFADFIDTIDMEL